MPTNTGGGTTTSLDNTPQAVDDTGEACEDRVYAFDVMANDLGGNAKILWSIDNSSDDGSLDLVCRDVVGCAEYSERGARIWLEAGKIKYDTNALDWLAAGQTVEDQFTYAIRLSNGTLSWATVTITLTGTNDAPTISVGSGDSDSATLPETNAALTASGTLTVIDVDTMDVIDTEVSSLAVSGNRGGLSSDDLRAMLSLSGDEDLAADSGSSGNLGWSFNSDSEAFDYLAVGDSLTLSYVVTSTDGQGGSASHTIAITITGTNDGPVAVADTAAGHENQLLTIDVLANDTDADDGAVLTLTSATAPDGKGTASVVGGQLQFNPGSDFDHLADGITEVVVVSYTIEDEHGATSSSTLTITVTGTNDVPVAQAAANAVDEDDLVTGNVTATDLDDGAVLTYALVGDAPAGLTFSNDGSYSFDASSYDYLAAGEPLVLTIPFTASDGLSTSAQADLVITLTGTNDAPAVETEIADQNVDEDQPWSFTVPGDSFSDVDGDTLSYLATLGNGDPLPGWLEFDAASLTFSGTPPLNFNGTISLSVTASDGSLSASDTFDLVVNPVNDAPDLTGTAAALPDGTEDNSYTVTQAQLLQGWTDVDGDALTATGLTSSNGNVVQNVDGSYTITPSVNHNGPVTLSYDVTDCTVSVAANLAYDLAASNDAPEGANATLIIDEDTSHVFSAADFGFADPVEGDELASIIITTVPASGSLTFNGVAVTDGQEIAVTDIGLILFTPSADANGDDYASFTFQVRDDGGIANGGVDKDATPNTITIDVTPVNDAPALTGDQAVLADGTEDVPYVVSVADLLIGYSDVDGDPLVIFALTADHGAVTDNDDGTYTIVPEADYNGPVVLQYNVYDGTAETPATLSFSLAPVEDLPPETRVNDAADDMNFDDPALIAAFNGATVRAVDFDGGGGSDIILGGSAGQELNGQGGGDTIHGAGGDDFITGGGNGDTLYGGFGQDNISGDGGSDTIYGGSDNDTITGVGGSETIRGGSGDDSISGGQNGDQLWGGTGQDDFIFAVGDTGFGAATDTIHDFSHAEGDLIDLTAHASFAGGNWAGQVASQFALGAGQIGYVVNPDGSLTLYGDHDGNGSADFQLNVVGVGSLQTSDLLFGP